MLYKFVNERGQSTMGRLVKAKKTGPWQVSFLTDKNWNFRLQWG